MGYLDLSGLFGLSSSFNSLKEQKRPDKPEKLKKRIGSDTPLLQYSITLNVKTYDLTGLIKGQKYYLAITAYDKAGKESTFSTEITGIAK